jgi:hypothetical protein
MRLCFFLSFRMALIDLGFEVYICFLNEATKLYELLYQQSFGCVKIINRIFHKSGPAIS